MKDPDITDMGLQRAIWAIVRNLTICKKTTIVCIYEEMGVFVSQVMHSSDVKSEKVPFYVFPKRLLPPC